MSSRTFYEDPCRIIDSDSEEEDIRIPKNVPITVRARTPKVTHSRPTPRVINWGLEIEDVDQPETDENPQFLPSDNRPTSKKSKESRKSHKKDKRVPSAMSNSSSAGSGQGDVPAVVVTNEEPASTPSLSTTITPTPTATQCNFDPFALIQENLPQFVYTYIPKEYPDFIQCCLRRDRSGVQGNFFPTFYLQAERPTDGRKTLLLAARRIAKVNRLAEYHMTTNVEMISRATQNDGYVGKLRGNNLSGTEYTLYDNGLSPNKVPKSKQMENQENLRRELGAIIYNTNLLGVKGPRQMSVVLPELGHTIRPFTEDQTILGQWKSRRMSYLIPLRNKSPKYNEATKTYVIQFIGNRVVKPSVKNFQILMEDANHEEVVVMQFGRVDEDVFVCDYRYPLSAIQAFAIALSSFDSRIARE